MPVLKSNCLWKIVIFKVIQSAAALLFCKFVQLDILYSININLLKPTGHVMHQQFNIQQLYALPTLYLCVLYLSDNKQRLVPLTA